jgi:hypothetical protein
MATSDTMIGLHCPGPLSATTSAPGRGRAILDVHCRVARKTSAIYVSRMGPPTAAAKYYPHIFLRVRAQQTLRQKVS